MKRAVAVVFLSAALASLVGCHSDKKKDKPAVIKNEPAAKASDSVAAKTEIVPEAVAKEPGNIMLTEQFQPVDADFDRPLEQLVLAGKYGYRTLEETEANYPLEKEPNARGKRLVSFAVFSAHVGSKPFEREEVVSKMAGLGYRPATLRELLVFGEKFPEEQKKDPVFALASIRSDEKIKKARYMALDYSQGPKDKPVRSLAFRPAIFKDGKEIFYRSLWVPGFLAVKD
jgi:hypothetical protein